MTSSRTAVIKDCRKQDKDDRPASEQKVCLYTQDGKKLLGRHPDEEDAEQQERAIQVNTHGSVTHVVKYRGTYYQSVTPENAVQLQRQIQSRVSSGTRIDLMAMKEQPKMVKYAGHLYVLAADEAEELEVEVADEETEEKEELEEETEEIELLAALKGHWQTILDKLPDDLEVDEDFEDALNGIDEVIGVMEKIHEEYAGEPEAAEEDDNKEDEG